MKLIAELNEDISVIEEADGSGKKKYFLEGIYAQAEIPNKNKRRYPLPVLEKEINRFTKDHVMQGRAWGELGHPQGPNINLDRACILIKEFKQNRNDFIGKSLVTSTPMGDIVRGLIDDGAKLGVSTRALGSLKPIDGGLNEVQDDLRLLAVDVVADPSAPNAYVNGIMEEKSFVWDAYRKIFKEQEASDIQHQIKTMTLPEIEDQKVKMFKTFITRLANYYN